MSFRKTLSRDEMKNVMAGSGCTETNCWMCEAGGWGCGTPGEDTMPREEDSNCSWGICPECC